VTVDRQVVTELGTKVDPSKQRIYVDGEPVRMERKRYFLLFKPKGVVCTAHDPANRVKAIDLLPRDFGRLFTVGRLDETSEGLLLVTNDGDLAHRLAHPRFQVERRYRVLVAGVPTPQTLAELKRGLHFAEGKFRVRDVRQLKSKGKSTILELTLTEGQNREIRRLLARVGHKVMALRRIAFGPLRLGDLEAGEFRELSPAEVKGLQAFAAGERSHKPQTQQRGREPRQKVGGGGRPAPNLRRAAPRKLKRRKPASARRNRHHE
jgi:23S rRNA pseudouridine2605 synthase